MMRPQPPPGFALPPIGSGAPEYDRARRVWNNLHDASPRWILRCVSSAEVAAGLRFARELDVPLAVRGGGHSFAGYGTCDGGVVLDLSPMSMVEIDLDRGRAAVGGGASWATVDAALAAHQRAVPGGLVSTTGVGGLTLGGGIGWLSRRYGLTCDQLIGAEVVMASGETLAIDEASHPDLLWALRGGGGNFGVVSRFEFRLSPLPTASEIFGGMVLYPAEAAGDVLRGCSRIGASAPDELTLLAALVSVPPEPFLPAEIHFAPAVAVAICDLGDARKAEARAEPLRRLAKPLADLTCRLPFVELQRMFDDGAPAGLRQYASGADLDRLEDAAIAILVESAARRPHPLCQIHLHQVGGAVARVAEEATAYSGRGAAWIAHVIGTWTEPRDDERGIEWARDTCRRLRAEAAPRSYSNFLGGEPRVAQAYGHAKFERLRRLKRRYDPENLFRLNPNIPPAS